MGGSKQQRFRRQNKILALIAIGLTILMAVAYFFRPHVGPKAAGSPTKPLPEIIKPGENWLSPSDIAVVDGDTIRTKGRTIRLVGFNAPETGNRARCSAERELGERATARLKSLIANGGLELRLVPCACPPGTEGTQACNFGRACAYLRVHGRDVGTTLISERLAKPFHCGLHSCPPLQTWC